MTDRLPLCVTASIPSSGVITVRMRPLTVTAGRRLRDGNRGTADDRDTLTPGRY
jgi:hypothetical protein